jgi:hypothetical protein
LRGAQGRCRRDRHDHAAAGYYAHAGFGGVPPTIGQRRFVNLVDGYARR